MKMMQRLWNDEAGFVVSAELVLIATIAVLGLAVGLAAVRDGITSELADVAQAMNSLNQSYIIDGVLGHSASVAGSLWNDNSDFCDNLNPDTPLIDEACITHPAPPPNEAVPPATPTLQGT
jgi:Flp pilus assembly pilin Flp